MKIANKLVALLLALTVVTSTGCEIKWHKKNKEIIKFTVASTEWTINDEKQEEMTNVPFIEGSRIYLPIQYVASSLGIKEENINWDREAKTVTLIEEDEKTGDKITLEAAEDSNILLINGEEKTMDGIAINQDEILYLPLSQIAQVFNSCDIKWDNQIKQVSLIKTIESDETIINVDAVDKVKVLINTLNDNDAPITQDGYTYYSIDFMADKFNAKVEYDKNANTLTITVGDAVAVIDIASGQLTINDELMDMIVKVIQKKDKFYIDTDSVEKIFDCTISNDGKNVSIDKNVDDMIDQIVVDNSQLNENTMPQVKQGALYIPLKLVSNKLGLDLTDNEGVYTITSGGSTISVTEGDTEVTIGDTVIPFEVPVYTTDEDIFIPATVISKLLNCYIRFEPTNEKLTIAKGIGQAVKVEDLQED